MGNLSSSNPLNRFVFIPPTPDNRIKNYNFNFIKTERNYSIPYIFINHPNPKKLIIYSHGNSEDISSVYSWCVYLSKKLSCSIVVYDYCGYGVNKKSNIKPNETMVKMDIINVIDHFSKFVPLSNIVLYGRSLGSGPTIYAAHKYNNLSGCIIESGFLSTMKTVLNVNFKIWFDIFRNEDYIKKVKIPTLIVHGDKDRVVPIYHGKRLSEKCGNTWGTLWVKNAGHNNLDQSPYMENMIFKINHFINSI